ncbi:MAG TPA: DEAD/DEAH box helicase, partial [Thermoplasmatales archaeon]|nr:DEAD/DEAH box helicase [Thermoplasmatales archaeon]
MRKVFDLLDERIRRVLKKSGIENPTHIQEKAIPAILEGKNVLLIAPTGLGKTEAALLPVFHMFLEQKENRGISILYITPLRALNRDMLRRTIGWGYELGIEISVRHGDTSQTERVRQVKKPPDMLITTPETFQILFTGKRLREYLKNVRWVIVDEIHELASEDRGFQLSVALERLEELAREKRHSFQRIGLSATVGSPIEVARFLVGVENGKFREVSIIEVDTAKSMDIEVELIKDGKSRDFPDLEMDSKIASSLLRCKELIENHNATLLFVNTRDTAEILGSRFHLLDKEFPIEVHHGSLSKRARIDAEERFKKGLLKALICTSSLELGIDVGHADFVIQYTSPRQVTRLLQRVGRSGHKVGKISKGRIISLNLEDFAESIVIARRALSKELERLKVRRNPLIVLANQIVSMALEYREIEVNKIYDIIRRAYPFSELSWEVFFKVLHQLESERRVRIDNNVVKPRKRSRMYFIDNISMIPDEKSYAVVDITSRKRIGKLDESFVLSNAYEGATFILQGRPWKVVNVEDEVVLVTPIGE